MSYLPEDRLIGRRFALRPSGGRRSEPANPLIFVAEDILAAFEFGRRLVTGALAAALRWRRINPRERFWLPKWWSGPSRLNGSTPAPLRP